MRILVAACVVLGACAFEPGYANDPNGPGGGSGGHAGLGSSSGSDDMGPDGGITASRTCQFADGSLRLCLDFEDRQVAPKVTDASSMRLDSDSVGLSQSTRETSVAVSLSYGSGIHVPESPALDLTTALTIELWVNPAFNVPANLVVNQHQFYLQLDGQGRVGCTLGSSGVWTEKVAEARDWTHVACTLAGDTMRVYVDGDLDKTLASVPPLVTTGTDGTFIGAGSYPGELDDIRVYASALSSSDICTHAGRTACEAK